MQVFGHAGLTLGIAVLLAGAAALPRSAPRRGVGENSERRTGDERSADSRKVVCGNRYGLLRRYAARNDWGVEGFRDSCLFRVPRFVFRASSPSGLRGRGDNHNGLRWKEDNHLRGALNGPGDHPTAWLTALARRIDLRLLLVASLLPDIIDKPLGHLFFREAFSSGRIFSHTLLFLLLLGLLGLWLYRSAGRTWLLVLAFGTATHLIFDQMWRNAHTLLWPLYGLLFDRADLTDWIPHMLKALVTNPGVYLPELAGAAILAWFAVILLRRKGVRGFLRHGTVC